MLVASGLVAAGSTLPGEWFSPEVEMGVLPAHAQVSPVPPYSMVGCDAIADWDDGGPYIEGYCEISPADAGIEIVQTITLNEPGHPGNGELRVETGVTDALGRFTAPDFGLRDLFNLDPYLDEYNFIVTWAFVDDTVGTGTCVNTFSYLSPQ
jgi:hypothetical protein